MAIRWVGTYTKTANSLEQKRVARHSDATPIALRYGHVGGLVRRQAPKQRENGVDPSEKRRKTPYVRQKIRVYEARELYARVRKVV